MIFSLRSKSQKPVGVACILPCSGMFLRRAYLAHSPCLYEVFTDFQLDFFCASRGFSACFKINCKATAALSHWFQTIRFPLSKGFALIFCQILAEFGFNRPFFSGMHVRVRWFKDTMRLAGMVL